MLGSNSRSPPPPQFPPRNRTETSLRSPQPHPLQQESMRAFRLRSLVLVHLRSGEPTVSCRFLVSTGHYCWYIDFYQSHVDPQVVYMPFFFTMCFVCQKFIILEASLIEGEGRGKGQVSVWRLVTICTKFFYTCLFGLLILLRIFCLGVCRGS